MGRGFQGSMAEIDWKGRGEIPNQIPLMLYSPTEVLTRNLSPLALPALPGLSFCTFKNLAQIPAVTDPQIHPYVSWNL